MLSDPRNQSVSATCGEPAISGIRDISRRIFWHAHPTTIRMLLGLSSLLYALAMFINPSVLQLPHYRIMMQIMPMWLWIALMVTHFIGVFWRVFDTRPRVRWAIAINVLGCYLWFTLTIATNLSMGRFIPGSSLEVITCLFAAWALIRTGVGKDVGTP